METDTHPTALRQDQIERLADVIFFLQRNLVLTLSEGLGKNQISFPQFFLLAHINASARPLTMTEIAERMHHTTAAATGLVDRLENLGYLRRTSAENDRRKVLVSITAKGAELVNEMKNDISEKVSQLCSSILTPEQQHSWLEIYEKIFNYCSQKCCN
ncbi:MAG TPA: MarR family transcriptional regulator [Chthoniobacterales bacterium]